MKIHHLNESCIAQIAQCFTGHLREVEELVFLCIGTDRSTGDSFGPLVGTWLSQSLSRRPVSRRIVHVYGTIHEPVHALNLVDTLAIIQDEHPNAAIIAIDSCLGRNTSIGCLSLAPEPLKPGAGVNREDLPEVGDYSIKGIVNVAGLGGMEYYVLQSTRLSLVLDMAEVTASGIETFLHLPEAAMPKEA